MYSANRSFLFQENSPYARKKKTPTANFGKELFNICSDYTIHLLNATHHIPEKKKLDSNSKDIRSKMYEKIDEKIDIVVNLKSILNDPDDPDNPDNPDNPNDTNDSQLVRICRFSQELEKQKAALCAHRDSLSQQFFYNITKLFVTIICFGFPAFFSYRESKTFFWNSRGKATVNKLNGIFKNAKELKQHHFRAY